MSRPSGHLTAQERQRRALALWEREWDLDLALRDGQGTGPAVACRAAGQPGPCTGDIRLLPPAPVSIAALERPVYIAVLREVAEASFEVAPFSRFSTPALPLEWETGSNAIPLRILCLWNRRRVTADLLSLTWKTARLSAAQLKTALSLAPREPPPGRYGSQAPPGMRGPLLHPLDPRHQYQAEERLLVDELLAGLHSAGTGQTLVYEIHGQDRTLPMAAERPDKEGPYPIH